MPTRSSSTSSRRLLAVAIGLLLATVGCSAIPAPGGTSETLHQQAEAALARWDSAAAAAGGGVVFVGELTQQVGDWEEAIGNDAKVALMAGRVEAAVPLPSARPADGEVRWPDGTTRTVALLSAASSLAELRASAGTSCAECRALRITGAELTTATAATARGPATTPVWSFALEGTAVRILRVAVASRVSVVPPSWDPMAAPQGIAIDSARLVDERHLTVSFVGAPGSGSTPCGADYVGEAVESARALVVIVVEHRNPIPGACSAIGAIRSADITLASPLGDRAVLDVQQGLPVAVARP
jgi:hypothetical protein